MPWDIGGWELFVLAVIAIIVVGPKELPKMLRSLGRWMAKARVMARDFQRSFEDIAREAELDELRKEVNALRTDNPLAEIKRDLEKSIDPTLGPNDPSILDEFGGYDPSAMTSDDVPRLSKEKSNQDATTSEPSSNEKDEKNDEADGKQDQAQA